MSANPGTSEEIEELENSTGNPWLVENIQAFSFLNCPECAFKVKEVGIFQDHAVRNHSQSSVLFGPNVKSEFIAVKTEQNSEISIEHPIMDPLESVMNKECPSTEIKSIAMVEQSVNQTETCEISIEHPIIDPLESVMNQECPEIRSSAIDEQSENQTKTLSKNLDEEMMDILKAPEPVKKKVVLNSTIPTFSVNNLSRKAQEIFKESIGKESEKVSNNVCNPDQSPIQPNSEISSEGVLSSNSDEITEFKITIDEQNIDPLKLSKEIEIAKLQIENLTSNRQRRNVFDKTSKLNDQNDIDETQVAYRDRHFISHEGKEHLTCFPCHICTKVFQTKFDVNSHIASVH